MLLITADMTIAKIVDLVPRASDILADFSIGCHGCVVGGVESLRDGMLAHGLTENDIEEAVYQINEIATEPIPTIIVKGIEFTETAYAKVLECMRNDPKKRKNLGLRIEMTPNKNNSQPSYYFDLVANKKPGELTLKGGSLTIFITPENYEAFKKRLIDFRETPFGTGFKITEKEKKLELRK